MSWEDVERRIREVEDAVVEELRLRDGNIAKVYFLDVEPYCFRIHRIALGGRYPSFVCLSSTDEECPLCERGERAQFVGAFSVYVDYIEDDEGKKEVKKVMRYVPTFRTLKVLMQHHKRKGLGGKWVEITRIGSGTDTTYTFELGQKDEALIEEAKKWKKLDFAKIFAPKKRKDLLEILGEEGTDLDNEEIPF